MQVKGVNFPWLWRIDSCIAHSRKLPSPPSKYMPPLADPWSLRLGKRDATVWLLTEHGSLHGHMSSGPKCGQAALCRHLVAMHFGAHSLFMGSFFFVVVALSINFLISLMYVFV